MATKPSAATAAASLPPSSNNDVVDTIKTVTVKCVWWNTTKSLTINLIFHHKKNQLFDADIEKDNDDDDNVRKYTLCSLLLQLGKVFEIQPPPYAPSPRISSIFTKLLECWSLHHNNNEDGNNNCNKQQKKIEGLDEIQDGDKLLFLFGDYFQKISSLPQNNNNNKDDDNDTTHGNDEKKIEESSSHVDLLELLPKKYNLVTVHVIHDSTNGNEEQKEIECIEILSSSSSDDEVEDVTDMYIKSRPPPEVIEVEDASDDDNEWEKDEYGNLRRTAAYFERKRQGNNHVKNSRRGDDGSSAFGSKKSSSSCSSNVNNNDDASMFDSDGDSDNYNASDNGKEEDINDDDDDDDSSIEDVTDIMRAKKLEEQQKLIDEAELLETDSEDDKEDTTKKKKKRKRTQNCTTTTTTTQGGKRRKVQLSPIEVVIDDEDVPNCPGAACEEEEEKGGAAGQEGNTTDDANDNDVDLSIKQRIIKLLNTGLLHNESNEHEAKNAMKLARRLLDRYNLDQAVLLRERGDGSLNAFSTTNDKDNESSLRGGIVTVHILNRRKTVPLSSMPRWLENLTAPVKANFCVDAFMTFSKARAYRSGKCSVSFFGIKTNAQLAAYAFKTAAERIAFMTASYEPPRSEVARRRQASQTRTARLSYALGIVAGLDRDVQKGLQEEEQKRQEELKRARNAAKTKTGEAYQEDEDCCDDHDNESQQQQQQQQESVPVDEKLQQLETEHEARLALVDCNKKIAEDVLKSQKIKLSSRKKRSSISFNRSSYETGVVHSKEIDLNQKALQQS